MNLLERSFLFNLFSIARFSHAKKYLIKNLKQSQDPYKSFVLSKNKERSICIWAIQQIKHRKEHFSEDLFFWELSGTRWLANLDQVHGLYEYLQGDFDIFYPADYSGKRILDIGGYIGDSAHYFLKKGARHVVIYEPVEKNVLCMRHNLKYVRDKVKIMQKAVGASDGHAILSSNYPGGHIGFGNREGKYQISVSQVSFSTILSQTKADIAKVDCEGNEKYLLQVPGPLLRHIPYWIIEIHEGALAGQMKDKFLSSGFKTIDIPIPSGHMGILHFAL